MTVILRLEGLDVKAGPEDIRSFFKSFHIPEGGVYILGGTLREAFIAFKSERDGQLALRNSGSLLKGSTVRLYVSSMKELEHKLKVFLKTKKKKKNSQLPDKKVEPKPADTLISPGTGLTENMVANLSPATGWSVDTDTANAPQLNAQQVYLDTQNVQNMDSSTAFLFGMCTILHGLRSSQTQEMNNFVPRDDSLKDQTMPVTNGKTPGQIMDATPGYARMFGLPATTTKEDICHFFKGLTVLEAMVNVELGVNHGCLVKFATIQEAENALQYNQHSLGHFNVEVRGATEKMWNSVLHEYEKENPKHIQFNEKEKQSFSSKETKRKSINHSPYKPKKKPKHDFNSTDRLPDVEQVVMVTNLPKTMTKTELKEFFECPNILHRNVLHLLNSEGERTDTAFLIFDSTEDYNYALNLSGCHLGSATIEVSPVTKKTMREMIAQARGTMTETDRTGLFLRNMPADVERSQILNLFYKYHVRTEDITILLDRSGNGIGEALVEFKSAKLAEWAHKIHGIDFLGSKLLLTLITTTQMGDILEKHFQES